MKNTFSMTVLLGRQVERRSVVRHGHRRFEPVAGGATFASRFPDLVGQSLTIGPASTDLASRPRMIEAVQWIAANGYLLRG